MYQKDLKKFDIRELKKLITSMKRGRDAAQKTLDIAESARMSRKGNIGAKSRGEIRKSLRFYERSINAAEIAKSKLDKQ
jgi:hypothetical protein